MPPGGAVKRSPGPMNKQGPGPVRAGSGPCVYRDSRSSASSACRTMVVLPDWRGPLPQTRSSPASPSRSSTSAGGPSKLGSGTFPM